MTKHYELIIVPLRSEVPEEIRLRKILKALRRAYSFRCQSVKRIEPKEKKSVDRMVHRPGAAATALKLIESQRRPLAPRTKKRVA